MMLLSEFALISIYTTVEVIDDNCSPLDAAYSAASISAVVHCVLLRSNSRNRF